jgi:hypothetical protein
MQCDMFFIDKLVAMDSIMQFLSSTSALWEDSQYVSPPEEQETEEVQILQDTSQVKAKGRKSRTNIFSGSEDKLLCESWLKISLDGA